MVTATSDNSFEPNGNLILARRLNEAVELSGGITVRVVEIKGRIVRLSFHAPREVRVLRAELADRDAPLDRGPQRNSKRAG